MLDECASLFNDIIKTNMIRKEHNYKPGIEIWNAMINVYGEW